jgi:hypothetical protein
MTTATVVINPAPGRRRRDLRAPLAVGAVTALALVLRLAGIGDKSLWLDEAFSTWVANLPLDQLWRTTLQLDTHPPLYYTLLHFWISPQSGEVALRSLSALWEVATVPVVYLTGRAIGGRRLGLLVALLQAVSPLHVWYAQQGRMYAMLTFFAAVALLCLVRLLVGGLARGATLLCWAGFVLATVLTMLSQNTGVLLPVTVAVFVAGVAVHRVVDERRRRADQHATSLLPAPSAQGVLDHVRDLVSAWAPAGTQIPLLVGAVAMVGLAGWSLRHRPALFWLLVLLVVGPAVGELLVSARRPIFYAQTLVWTSVPLTLLLGVGLRQLRRWWPTTGHRARRTGAGRLPCWRRRRSPATSCCSTPAGPRSRSTTTTAAPVARRSRRTGCRSTRSTAACSSRRWPPPTCPASTSSPPVATGSGWCSATTPTPTRTGSSPAGWATGCAWSSSRTWRRCGYRPTSPAEPVRRSSAA